MKKLINNKVTAIFILALTLGLLISVPMVKADVDVTPGGTNVVDTDMLMSSVMEDITTNVDTSPTLINLTWSLHRHTMESFRIEDCVHIEAEGKSVDRQVEAGRNQPDYDYKKCAGPEPTRTLKVVAATPNPNAIVTDPNLNVTATFNNAVKPDSINIGTFTLKIGDHNGAQVAAIVSYDPLTKKATLDPAAPLQDGFYTAAVEDAVRDANGVPITEPYIWSFTVDNCLDGQVSTPDGSCAPE